MGTIHSHWQQQEPRALCASRGAAQGPVDRRDLQLVPTQLPEVLH